MKIRVSDRAFRQLKKIPEPHREQLLDGINSLGADPKKGKRLKGKLSSYQSLRVGDYRIIYLVSKESVDVIVLGHRKNIYEIIRRLLNFLFGL